MVTVFVTGGAGVIGRALVPKLLDRGARVRIYDLKPPPLYHKDVEFVKGDIRDADKLNNAVKGCEMVFHLAAKMPQAKLTEKGFYDFNVRGTINVAEACIRNGIKRLIFASTTEIYGPQPVNTPLTEDAQKLFTGHYSKNKFECEMKLLEYHKKFGLEVTFLRMPMIFGPGFYHEKSILGVFILARYSLPIPIPSPHIPVSFVSAEDCADAFILASENPKAVGEAFNIAAEDHPQLGAFLESFVQTVGSRSKIIVIPDKIWMFGIQLAKVISVRGKFFYTPSELLDFSLVGGAYSIEKAKRILGYHPKKTCLQAWSDTYSWFFSQKPWQRAYIFFFLRV